MVHDSVLCVCVCREEEEVGMDILDEVGVNLQVRWWRSCALSSDVL